MTNSERIEEIKKEKAKRKQCHDKQKINEPSQKKLKIINRKLIIFEINKN